jgi:cytochrome P450
MDRYIDLGDTSFFENRRETYRKLRNENPIALAELNGEPTAVITRYEDVMALLTSKIATVQPAPDEFPSYIGTGPASHIYRSALPSLDDPDHGILRKVMAPAFGPSAVARLSQAVSEIMVNRLNEIEDEPVIDFVARLGSTIPVDVACHLLHVPLEDGGTLVSHVDGVNLIFSQQQLSAEELDMANAAAEAFFRYFSTLLDNSPDSDAQDIFSLLAEAERNQVIDRDHCITMLLDVFLASYHTTMVSLSNAIEALAYHADARSLILEDSSSAAQTWEEVLRYDSPVHFRHRYVREAITLSGHVIRPRTKVMVGLASANNDETVFTHADTFRMSEQSGRHVAFGGGRHFCLGAFLSRLEGRIFLPQFLKRFPNFQVAGPKPPRAPNLTFPHIERLMLELKPDRLALA